MDFWGIRDISTWKGFFLYTCMELLIFLLSSLSIVNIDSQYRYVGSFCTVDSQMIKETKNWMLFFPLLVMILFTFSDVNVFGREISPTSAHSRSTGEEGCCALSLSSTASSGAMFRLLS